jgi:putative flippase GtrA
MVEAVGLSRGRTRARLRRLAHRFSRYTALSLGTVVLGYSLLLMARQVWDVNAGLLNLGVAAVLTVPSFALHRLLVWPARGDRGLAVEFGSFLALVVAGALASTVTIGLADASWHPAGGVLVLAGLLGQGTAFLARFVWLDRVTFTSRGGASSTRVRPPDEAGRGR